MLPFAMEISLLNFLLTGVSHYFVLNNSSSLYPVRHSQDSAGTRFPFYRHPFYFLYLILREYRDFWQRLKDQNTEKIITTTITNQVLV